MFVFVVFIDVSWVARHHQEVWRWRRAPLVKGGNLRPRKRSQWKEPQELQSQKRDRNKKYREGVMMVCREVENVPPLLKILLLITLNIPLSFEQRELLNLIFDKNVCQFMKALTHYWKNKILIHLLSFAEVLYHRFRTCKNSYLC